MASTLLTRASRPISCSACRTTPVILASGPNVLGSSPSTAAAQPPPSSRFQRAHYSASTEPAENGQRKPRWSYTPPLAKGPFSLRFNSKRPQFLVNADPKRLDEFYIRMLGEGGDNVLSEEVKWLAVTHKSFDQGRRGFNDRLAFIGKRIVDLQTSLALVQNQANSIGRPTEDAYGRKPFTHPALEGLNSLTNSTKMMLTSRLKVAGLAQKYGLHDVLRWAPRKPENLGVSGVDLVLAHTMYAVVGAVSLEKGGNMANKIARERILEPLGVKTIS